MEPLKTFYGKTAIWYYIVLSACILLPICMIVQSGFTLLNTIILFLILIVCAFFVTTIIRNKVDLYDAYFVYTYGFSSTKVFYRDIHKMERTKTLLAGSANSLDRIYIDTKENEILLALKDNEGFMKLVKRQMSIK